MIIPEYLMRFRDESEKNKKWVDSLPEIMDRIRKNWNLEIGNPFLENVTCSYVAPCKVNNKIIGVLKIGFPHEEATHEIEGLMLLNGNPTVNVLKVDKETNSMLLEKCEPGIHLSSQPEPYQDEIICNTLMSIWKAKHNHKIFRPLSIMVAQWNKETRANLNNFPNPELALKGCKMKENLVNNSSDQFLLATDLHAGNVLKAERREWLAIDIKPYVGDRAYDLTQHILNCMERFDSDPFDLINRLSNLAIVNKDRLLKWTQARLLSENNGMNQELGKSIL